MCNWKMYQVFCFVCHPSFRSYWQQFFSTWDSRRRNAFVWVFLPVLCSIARHWPKPGHNELWNQTCETTVNFAARSWIYLWTPDECRSKICPRKITAVSSGTRRRKSARIHCPACIADVMIRAHKYGFLFVPENKTELEIQEKTYHNKQHCKQNKNWNKKIKIKKRKQTVTRCKQRQVDWQFEPYGMAPKLGPRKLSKWKYDFGARETKFVLTIENDNQLVSRWLTNETDCVN